MGGFLANPVSNYPAVFGSNELFTKFPYLLPCLVCSCISFTGLVLGYFLLDETLDASRRAKVFNKPAAENVLETKKVAFSKRVIQVVIAYGTWCGTNTMFDEGSILFMASSITQGGLSMSSIEIGVLLSYIGGKLFML